MSDTKDYKQMRENLDDLLVDIAGEQDEEKLNKKFEEVLDRCTSTSSATPDEMETLVLGKLLRSPQDHFDLVDVYDGNIARAARSVVNFMVSIATHPDRTKRRNLTPIEALNHANAKASEWKRDMSAAKERLRRLRK